MTGFSSSPIFAMPTNNPSSSISRFRSHLKPVPFFLLLGVISILETPTTKASAQQAVSLMKPSEPGMGWTFNNAPEFPGAKGGIEADSAEKHNGQESLKMTADFTGGGVYVQAEAQVDGIDIREFSVWLKNLQQDQITLRFVDGSGRCHQFSLRTEAAEGWQRLVFPLEQFFSRKGDSNTLPMVAKYEAWGGPDGAPTGTWSGPAKFVGIVLGNQPNRPLTTVWINGASIIPRPMETAGAKDMGVPETVPLDEVIDGEHFWQFHDGREFPGAKGGLVAVPEESAADKHALKLSADFSDGGVYVTSIRNLEEFGWKDLKAVRLRIKSEGADRIGIRLGDGTGQTHQKKGVPIAADGKWHDLVIRPSDIAGGEHWGGANDGKWHGSPKYLSIALEKTENNPAKTLLMADIQADALLSGKSGEVTWQEGFEASEGAPKGWTLQGAGQIDMAEAFKGGRSLVLEKTEETLTGPVAASGPSFPVKPGMLEVQFAGKSDLESMDNSYNGSLGVEFLDAAGKPLSQLDLVTLFRKNNWKPEKKQIEVPAGAVSARFVAKINKETPGKIWLDELTAAAVVGERKDDRLRRMMFSTAQIGNLLFPEDSREVTVEVWAAKPLPGDQRKLSVTVKDYWGAEQGVPLVADLEKDGRANELFRYKAKVDLKSVPLEVGRYYELHGAIERKDGEPFTNYTSLAILPEAPANGFKAEEVPFTSRNWDNRLTDYVLLTKRLGIRICGIWGKMEADPAKVEAPQLDRVKELGMGFLTGSPAHDVEQRVPGWEQLLANDGEKLRQGVRNFIEKYGNVRPAIVNLGNEPHAKGEDVKANIEAYRAVYQEIKKIDPAITVVATSAGIQEDYFKYGIGEWCDAYDFHVYEDALSVRKIVQEKFPEMFKKYGHPKPVWSTELGLNSQGMARQFVAAELYRKFANFFAGGGANVSWFGLLYPDAEGKSADSFGAAHNVFDSRYARYAPKLDAIAYYNAVNAIGIKKYVQDKIYGTDTRAFLFRDRDNRALQIWYKDKGREDVFIPLPDVKSVDVIRIDGTRRALEAGGKGVTLTIGEDPLLLLYDGGEKTLPEKMGDPAIRLGDAPGSLLRGEPNSFDVILGNTLPDRVDLVLPPLWKSKAEAARSADGKAVERYTLEVPENSTVRAVDLTVALKDAEGRTSGELYYRPSVTGAISVQVLPVPGTEGHPPAVKLVVQNNSPSRQQVTWDVSLTGEQDLKDGEFAPPVPAAAFFADTPSGLLEIEGRQTKEVLLPLSEADLYKVYRVRAMVRDITGRVTTQERPIGAFYGVPKAKAAPVIDGRLDEEAWKNAPVRKLDMAGQFFAFPVKDAPKADWKSPDDLSAEIRYLWDDQFLYISVKVKDDVAGKILHQDSELWQQDGLQFLIDPMRTSDRKIGKYEYSVGEGTKGPQTWCTLSADGAAAAGDVPSVKLAIRKDKEGTGDLTYEMAFPWSRLAPFQPAPGSDLGFTLIVNEDDGNSRDSFMTWFGNAHSKDIDTVGDLILEQ